MNKNKSKFSEFIGILLGDGCLSIYKYKNKKFYRLQITLDARNDQYINYISKLILKIFCIKAHVSFRKKEHTCDIKIFNREIIDFLIDGIGLKLSPKWGRAVIPKKFYRTKYVLDVLRGYFDTDGCITIVNNNGIKYPRIEMKICPSPMQKQFIKALQRYGFNFGVYQIGKGKVRVQLNGKKQVYRWSNLIGSNNIAKRTRIFSYSN